MNKFWIILAHTYLNRLKSKPFVLTTIITALLVIGLANIQSIIGIFDKDEVKKIAIVDHTDQLYQPLQEQMIIFDEKIRLIDYDGTITEAEQDVTSGQYTALLELSSSDTGLPMGTYKSMMATEQGLINQLHQSLNQLKTGVASQQLGLTADQLQQVFSPVPFEKIPLKENAKTEEQLNQARGLVYVLLFVIYFTVLLYGNMIAMDVVTEKSSRVMEILISSASPVTQMFAKILGIALLALTQYAVIIGVGFFSFKDKLEDLKGLLGGGLGFENISAGTIAYAVLFFILGYLIYATLAAMLGSLVSRVEDAQQIVMPMTLMIVAAFMIAMFGLGQPDNPFITITSYIPFFAPMIMFLRVGMLSIPFWEVALSIGIMVATITLLGVLAARIYRGGVLMYGKTSSLKDFKRAYELTKK